MNVNIIKSAFVGLLATVVMVGCESSTKEKSEKLEEAKKDVVDATNDLNQARLDSANQYAKYKAAIDNQLLQNDIQIAAIKVQIAAEKVEVRTKSEKELNELLEKNAKLKATIKEHKDGTYNAWEIFKQDFNKQVDELGQSISAMAKRNAKK